MSTRVKEGWGLPNYSRKWHYFVEGTSLCSRYGFFFAELEEGNDESPDNCVACVRRLKEKRGGECR